ncbi:unnamed protein product [Alopecurus aequalis]
MAYLAFLVLFASLGAAAAQYSSPAAAPTPEMASSLPHSSPPDSNPSYTVSPAAAPTAEMPSFAPHSPQSSYPSNIGSPAAAPHSPQTSSPSYTSSPAASPSYPLSSKVPAPSVPSSYSSPPSFQDVSPHAAPAAAPSHIFPVLVPAPSPQDSFPSYIAPVAAPTPSPPSTATPSPSTPTPYPPSKLTLKVGFYRRSCPRAEYIIRETVRIATSKNPGIGAGLIRLHFHDCFVQGCDASILLDPTPANPQPEKLSPPNFASLRGFGVIDVAKEALEKVCPGRVSCADIIAFAARDAAFFLSRARISFEMPSGRLDGRVSLSGEALQFLPPPFFNLTQLVANFKAKNLDEDDLVVLSGAHSIGLSHCSSFTGFLAPNPPAMDPAFAAQLQRYCIISNATVNQDIVTPDRLDNRYYTNILNQKVLFASDAALLSSPQTSIKVIKNAFIPNRWETKFAKAIVKMAAIELKTAANGEIRRKCNIINN